MPRPNNPSNPSIYIDRNYHPLPPKKPDDEYFGKDITRAPISEEEEQALKDVADSLSRLAKTQQMLKDLKEMLKDAKKALENK